MRRDSSTSSSESPRPGWRLLAIKIAVFGLLFLCADQVFAVFKDTRINIFAKAADEKMAIASADLLDSRPQIDWLFMGSSHAQFGFDTDAIQRASGHRTYNLGYGGGFHLGEQNVLLDAYLKKNPKPQMIVLAVDVFALNEMAQGDGQLIKRFSADSTAGASWLARYRTWLGRWPLFLKTYVDGRNVLRYADECWGGRCTLPAFRPVENDRSELMYFSQYRGYRVTPTGFVSGDAVLNRETVRYAGVKFTPRADSAGALAEFARVGRDAGIRLVLVQLPEHEVSLKFGQKYTDFGGWMNRFASRWNVSYLDFDRPAAFPVGRDELFFDSDHLNAAGAELLARLLLERLQGSAP
jgi:hypothetical protein